jgi:hypothetical protein
VRKQPARRAGGGQLGNLGSPLIHGGQIVVTEDKRYFIWNDWSITEMKHKTRGDVLGMGSWGKIIISHEKTVAKVPVSQTNPQICYDFYKEVQIINELHGKSTKKPKKNSIKFSDIKTVKSSLAIGQPRIRGENRDVTSRNKKDSYIEISSDVTTDYEMNGDQTCIFFMTRIYKPKLSNIIKMITSDKAAYYKSTYESITKPYYLFLGRIGRQSIRGGQITVSDVDSVPLSYLKGVSNMTLDSPFQSTFSILFDNIATRYSGTQTVVSNYVVADNSPAMYYGVGICTYIWEVFLKNHIYLFDTEFILGEETHIKYPKTPNCYIIDFNRCEKHAILDFEKFVQSVAAGMEVNIEGADPEHWGGFLPNPLISPAFAFRCLTAALRKSELTEDIYVAFLQFMILFTRRLNEKLQSFDKQERRREDFELKQYYKPLFMANGFHSDTYEVVPMNMFSIPESIQTMLNDADPDFKTLIENMHTKFMNNMREFSYLWKQHFIFELILSFTDVYVRIHEDKGIDRHILYKVAKHKIQTILPDTNKGFMECLTTICSIMIENIPPMQEDVFRSNAFDTRPRSEEMVEGVNVSNISLFLELE